jgi:type II secretory pathway pseudopilin PulG
MKIRLASQLSRISQRAYTFIEVLTGVMVLGIMFVSFYAGMSSGFAVTQLARENLRATQIMLERMEGIRLHNWNQIVFSNMIPATFTNYYYPLADKDRSKGVAYLGTMTITNAGLIPAASYEGDMRRIVVEVRWMSGNVERTRTMSTFVARNGVQNYVYNN